MALFDYYTFQTNLAIERINEEINFFEQCDYNRVPLITDHIAYLKTRLGGNKYNSLTVTSFDKEGNKREIKKMNLDEYTKDMNTISFNRPWNKLREIHKIMKITEFADALKYKNNLSATKIEKNKLYVRDGIIEGLKMKKFLKNKSVIDYDCTKMMIISISSLVYNKKRHLYEINWDL